MSNPQTDRCVTCLRRFSSPGGRSASSRVVMQALVDYPDGVRPEMIAHPNADAVLKAWAHDGLVIRSRLVPGDPGGGLPGTAEYQFTLRGAFFAQKAGFDVDALIDRIDRGVQALLKNQRGAG